MVPKEIVDECDRLRHQLATEFTRLKHTQDRFALAEALRLIGAARAALVVDAVDAEPPTPAAASVVDWLDTAR